MIRKLTPALKDLIRKHTNVDKLTFKRDGTIVGKIHYFYRFGRTPDQLSERIVQDLGALGVRVTILESTDHWNPWPKDSWYEVRFTVSLGEKHVLDDQKNQGSKR
jgi:hypothetical protein